jgi:hypothetical protein
MNDLHEVKRNHSVLKNLNTSSEILKGIHKNEGTFYRIGKNTYERAFLYLDIISGSKAKSKTEESAIS